MKVITYQDQLTLNEITAQSQIQSTWYYLHKHLFSNTEVLHNPLREKIWLKEDRPLKIKTSMPQILFKPDNRVLHDRLRRKLWLEDSVASRDVNVNERLIDWLTEWVRCQGGRRDVPRLITHDFYWRWRGRRKKMECPHSLVPEAAHSISMPSRDNYEMDIKEVKKQYGRCRVETITRRDMKEMN